MKHLPLVAAAIAVLALSVAPAHAQRRGGGIDAAARTALLTALDEERKAEHAYQVVMAKFGAIAPFRNIVASEGVHIARVTGLLVRYGVPVPQNPWGVARFVAAPATLSDAFALGVSVEREDIEMFDALIPSITQRDIKNVFTNLRSASLNHLAAFEAAAGR